MKPYPWWTEEQIAFQKEVSDFLDTLLEREAKTRWTREFPYDIYEKIGEKGYTGAAIPKECGGLGLGCTGSVILADEVWSCFMISESGSIGGVAMPGLDFGAHMNIEASICQKVHFDWFDSGLLDFGAFGLSEVDQNGDINVSLLNGHLGGVGGFCNITSSANVCVFAGTFKAVGLKTHIEDGRFTLSFPVRPEQRNGYHLLQGGVISSFIDDAFGLFVYIASGGNPLSTINMNVNYHKGVTQETNRVLVTAYVIRAGRRVVSMEAEVRDPEGRLVATCQSNLLNINKVELKY